MKIYTYNKKFFKESKDIQRAIITGVEKLYDRIRTYEESATPFEKIFNDDTVKYDIHGEFYTFKTNKNHLQLRILYAYFKLDGEPVILIADYWIKKKNNKCYIEQFDSANGWNPQRVFEKSYLIA